MAGFLKKELRLKVSRKIFYLVIVPLFTLLVVVLVFLIVRGCGRPRTITEVVQFTPSEQVKEFYDLLKKGQVENARLLMTAEYFITDQVSVIEANKVLQEILKIEMVWAERTRLKIVEQDIKGVYAVVTIEQYSSVEDKTYKRLVYLVRKDTDWTIASVGIRPVLWPLLPEQQSQQ